MAESSTTIAVTWEEVPPIDQNGVIIMYEVMKIPLEDFEGAIVMKTVNVLEYVQFVELTELQEHISYNISVRAYTSVGAGPYSVIQTVQTLQDSKFGL